MLLTIGRQVLGWADTKLERRLRNAQVASRPRSAYAFSGGTRRLRHNAVVRESPMTVSVQPFDGGGAGETLPRRCGVGMVADAPANTPMFQPIGETKSVFGSRLQTLSGPALRLTL